MHQRRVINCLVLIFFTSALYSYGQINQKAGQDSIPDSGVKIISPEIEKKPARNPGYHASYLKTVGDQQFSQVVRKVFQDSKANFWLGTQEGAYRYDGKVLHFMDQVVGPGGKGVTIKDIDEDDAGNIWFGHTGGISRYDGKSVTNYSVKDGLISNDVWSIAAGRNNIIWIGTFEGACTFDGSAFKPFELPEGKPDSMRGVTSAKMVHRILEDRRGRIWFGTNAGAFRFDGTSLTGIPGNNGLQSMFVSDVFEDDKGGFWISSAHQGLFYYDNENLIDITKGILGPGVGGGSICQDRDGNIWFSSDGRDLYTYNGKDFTRHRIEQDDAGHNTFQIYKDRKDRLWFVGFNGAYRLENNEFVNVTKGGPW